MQCNLQFQHSGAIQTDFDDDIYVDHNDDVDAGSDLEIFFAKKYFPPEMVWNGEKVGRITFLAPWALLW